MRVVVSWSGGKDCAVALAELRGDHDVVGLFTTISAATSRSRMHGVRPELLRAQAHALGLPIRLVELPDGASNDAYEARMRAVTHEYVDLDAVAFADLRLDDVRAYREDLLADAPIDGCWPVWGRETDAFLSALLERGYEAYVVCAHDRLGPEFAGRRLDDAFREDLPGDVDPCGEDGEFHTFVVDGPPFDRRVAVERGDLVTSAVGPDGDRYHYRDLRPA